jgi:hypothetical protein
MGYLGYKPADKPLTSADITDNIITSAKITDATIVNGDINSSAAIALSKLSTTGTADATTFLRGDGAWSAVSSDYVLLATSTASSSSSISFDGYFSSTYSNYIIFINNMLPATDGAEPYIRFRRSNADITASDYRFITSRAKVSSAGGYIEAGEYSMTNNRISLNQDMDDSVLWSLHGTVQLYNPLNTASYPACILDTNGTNNGNGDFYRRMGAGRLMSTGALSGITFYFSSGNITSGTFKLYGIK